MNVLFLGGSLIGDGAILENVRALFAALGTHSVAVDSILVAKSRLADHWTNLNADKVLAHKSYQHVFLQEKATLPLDDLETSKYYAAQWRRVIVTSGARGHLIVPWRRVEHRNRPDLASALITNYEEVAGCAELETVRLDQVWRAAEERLHVSPYRTAGNHANEVGSKVTAAAIVRTVFPHFDFGRVDPGYLPFLDIMNSVSE